MAAPTPDEIVELLEAGEPPDDQIIIDAIKKLQSSLVEARAWIEERLRREWHES